MQQEQHQRAAGDVNCTVDNFHGAALVGVQEPNFRLAVPPPTPPSPVALQAAQGALHELLVGAALPRHQQQRHLQRLLGGWQQLITVCRMWWGRTAQSTRRECW